MLLAVVFVPRSRASATSIATDRVEPAAPSVCPSGSADTSAPTAVSATAPGFAKRRGAMCKNARVGATAGDAPAAPPEAAAELVPEGF